MMMRKMSTEEMWRRYSANIILFPEGVQKDKITLLISIGNTLITADINHHECIEYKLHGLVYVNVNTLRRIIEEQPGGTVKGGS